eukprot:CAMPEP_0204217168 /NCGR_PEP_ID=MMETSP0361-20130328/78704_1 /ASSEMBLY_ACC=CAM_ASM_000343 /TAXON_ID=268821 /ORGANISM="Scrippsiella Hangoei, Strain SHTV-5" /LENGTH=713 /DNA_ID=CAMNT_0051182141 /DNA_START=53 /DNA_END=2194 /DNA_ORIENTATION=+
MAIVACWLWRGALAVALPSVALAEAGAHVAKANPKIPDLIAALERVTGLFEKNGGPKFEARACAKAIDDNGLSEKALVANERFIKDTSDDIKTTKAQVDSIRNTVSSLKVEGKGVLEDISRLTAQLRNLRANHLAAEKRSKKSLQQLDAIITQAEWKEEHEKPRENEEPRKLTSDVSVLKRLGRELAPAGESAAASFLQVGSADEVDDSSDDDSSASERHAASGAAGVLQGDRTALLSARGAESREFKKQERELMELIASKREQLKKIEANINEQQPVLAEKTKESAEMEDAISFATREMNQLKSLRSQGLQTCDLKAKSMDKIDKLRSATTSSLKMTTKMIASMDGTMLLSKDLNEFADGAPSFVQLRRSRSRSRGGSSSGLGLAVQQALRAAEGASGSAAAEDDADNDASQSAPPSRKVAFVEADSEAAGGPFDKVADLIRSLMGNLRSQGNEDINTNQFCLNAKAENERNRFEAKVSMDEASSQILWAEAAIQRLDKQIAELREDREMLTKLTKVTDDSAKEEGSVLATQLTDTNNAKPVIQNTIDQLKSMCANVRFLQTASQSSSSSGASSLRQGASSKFDACQEALNLLRDLKGKTGALSEALSSYTSEKEKRDQEERSALKGAMDKGNNDLSDISGAKAKRTMELSIARGDKQKKESDLALVDKAATEIDSECSVKESADERLTKRQEEIESLKNAWKILNGDEIPV